MATIQELKELAATIKNETAAGANSAERIGGAFADTADLIETAQDTAATGAIKLRLKFGKSYVPPDYASPSGDPAGLADIKLADGKFKIHLGAVYNYAVTAYEGSTVIGCMITAGDTIEFQMDDSYRDMGVDRIAVTIFGVSGDCTVSLQSDMTTILSTIFENTRGTE